MPTIAVFVNINVNAPCRKFARKFPSDDDDDAPAQIHITWRYRSLRRPLTIHLVNTVTSGALAEGQCIYTVCYCYYAIDDVGLYNARLSIGKSKVLRYIIYTGRYQFIFVNGFIKLVTFITLYTKQKCWWLGRNWG